jgi:preprotein translocase subunit SecF
LLSHQIKKITLIIPKKSFAIIIIVLIIVLVIFRETSPFFNLRFDVKGSSNIEVFEDCNNEEVFEECNNEEIFEECNNEEEEIVQIPFKVKSYYVKFPINFF